MIISLFLYQKHTIQGVSDDFTPGLGCINTYTPEFTYSMELQVQTVSFQRYTNSEYDVPKITNLLQL